MEQAVDQLATLPGIGRRTAMRLALDLLRREVHEVTRFSDAIRKLREEVRYCEECCNISDQPRCTICQDPGRDAGLVCVVEDIRDVIAIENTRQYKGLYHVLGGVIRPDEWIGSRRSEHTELFMRVQTGPVREVILALGTTLEGDTTGFYLNRRLAGMGVLVTMLREASALAAISTRPMRSPWAVVLPTANPTNRASADSVSEVHARMKLSVVIVNYNVRPTWSNACVPYGGALEGLYGRGVRGGQPEHRRQRGDGAGKFPKVNLMANTENVGFRRANNQAIRASNAASMSCCSTRIPWWVRTSFRKVITFLDAHPKAGGWA
jgi:recombination protein RecR